MHFYSGPPMHPLFGVDIFTADSAKRRVLHVIHSIPEEPSRPPVLESLRANPGYPVDLLAQSNNYNQIAFK